MMMKPSDKVAYSGGGLYVSAIERPRLGETELPMGLLADVVPEPMQIALGCTFSPDICATVAKASAQNAYRDELAFAGTVAAGLIRNPMDASCSRLFSEDAFLNAELLKGYTPVGGLGFVFTDCLGQERFTARTIDSRALREMYLFPLMRAGRYAAGLQLDGGYLNGERVASSREVYELMTGFIPETAPVFTQYGDIPEPDRIYDTGVYILGADSNLKRDIIRNVNWGVIREDKMNAAIERMLSFALDNHDLYTTPDVNAFSVDDIPDISREAAVLLKNDGALPVRPERITLFGDATAFSATRHEIRPIKDAIKSIGTFNVFLITDYEANGIDPVTMAAVTGSVSAAQTVVVLCGGCAAELAELSKANAVLFCPDRPTVEDIIAMLTDAEYAPRGHLPFTWAKTSAAYPNNNKKFKQRGDFRYESLYNGHVLFDNFVSDIEYPFGHGLDYTSYELSKYKLTSKGQKINVEFVIKNTGKNSGTALVQAYLTLVDAPVYGISKRLAAFKKIALDPTENTRVELEIDIGDFAVYDEEYDSFITAGGKYRVEIGLSSRDIRLTDEIKVAAASKVAVGLGKKLAPSYYAAGENKKFEPTAPEIERLLKVPFIKKPDEHKELAPPDAATLKKALKRAEKHTPRRVMSIAEYLIKTIPDANRPQ